MKSNVNPIDQFVEGSSPNPHMWVRNLQESYCLKRKINLIFFVLFIVCLKIEYILTFKQFMLKIKDLGQSYRRITHENGQKKVSEKMIFSP